MPFLLESLNPTQSRFMTMEGMLQNANRVLTQAAKIDRNGSLSALLQRSRGIVLLSMVESAMVVSGGIGSGVVMAKDPNTGEWGPPCACGSTGTGWGFGIGAAMRDIIMFAFDDKSLAAFVNQVGLKVNVGTSLTLGTYGIDAGANLSVSQGGASGTANVSKYGIGGTVSIVVSHGAFACAAISGSLIGPRNHVNRAFYGDNAITAQKILLHGEGVDLLAKKREQVKATNAESGHNGVLRSIELVDEVYEKLHFLSRGKPDEVLSGPVEEVVQEVHVEAATFIDEIATTAIQKLDSKLQVYDEEKPDDTEATLDDIMTGLVSELDML